jgi:branched-chain amino acid transport system ATP-binding protein
MSDRPDPSLEVLDVSVAIGGVQVLDGVSLGVPHGGVLGLIGPNGAGKTTLFDVVSGVRRLAHGRILLDGRDVTGLAPHERARLGLARTFQRLELYPSLTVGENALGDRQPVGATPKSVAVRSDGVWGRSPWWRRRAIGQGGSEDRGVLGVCQERAPFARGVDPSALEALLEAAGLLDVLDAPTEVLSTGKARLVELVRALVRPVKVLLLDEPASGLEPAESAWLAGVVRHLAEVGLAVLLVEHDFSMVGATCDRVVVLDQGRVIAVGTPSEVRRDRAVLAAYLGTRQITRGVAAASDHPATRPAPPSPAVPGAAAEASMPFGNPGGRGARGLAGRERGRAGGEEGEADTAGERASSAVSAGSAWRSRHPDAAAQVATTAIPALQLEHVRAGYGRVEVLHDVELAVPEGALFALIGPNGAGKTTLVSIASGRLRPWSGTVRVEGRALPRTQAGLVARGVRILPEGTVVFPSLTVREHLVLAARAAGLDRQAAEEASYARFPVLASKRRQLAGTLSGGEQRMLALARVLVGRPRLVLLDELSMGLAPLVVEQLYEAIAALVREGTTVVAVEQFVYTIAEYATHAALIVGGTLSAVGSPAEVVEAAEDRYLRTVS